MPGNIAARAAALAFAIGLAACNAGPEPGAEGLALVERRLETDLNAATTFLHKSLVLANRDKRLFATELVVSEQGTSYPADWWVYEKGLMTYGGVDPRNSMVFFTLTPPGESLVAGQPPRWISARIEGEPELNCAGSRTWASCNVTGVAVIQPTAEGAPFLAGVQFPRHAFEADLEYGPQGWRVGELRTPEGGSPRAAARRAIFGERDDAYQKRYRFAEEVTKRYL